MRILILANNDVGLYRFRKELIEELLKNNKVYISLPYGPFVESLKEMGCIFIDTPLERRGMNPIKDGILVFRYLNIFERVKPELVITYTIKPNVYGGVVSRIKKIPYALNITGLGTAFQNRGILREVVILMYRIACKQAKVVFFENEENKRLFLGKKIVKNKQAYLLNGAGVNLEDFKVTEYPVVENTKFLFIGRVMREKGIDELFVAMRRLISEGEHCTLDVLGGCEEDYKNIIERYEREGWLHYHGYQKDVCPFIEKAHCIVLPSWHEGMANTNLEAAASGRPVITSNIHGCMEAVEDGVSGFLFEKKNCDSLYGVMKEFIYLSTDRRKEMGLLGRKRMEDKFDKRKVVDCTIRKLLGKK